MNFKVIKTMFSTIGVCFIVVSAFALAGCSERENGLYETPSGESTVSSSLGSINCSSESLSQYENELNIGRLEIAENESTYMYNIPGFHEMSRDEVLRHFGLNTDLDLSGVVDGLCETMPKNSIFNPDGKHGFRCKGTLDDKGNITWEDILPHYNNEVFRFESVDSTKSAEVFFSNQDKINSFRSGVLCLDENGTYSNNAFYELPTSMVAGVKMRISERSIGGYYAEFNTRKLCVGLSTKGLSENEIVSILEYLVDYVDISSLAITKNV